MRSKCLPTKKQRKIILGDKPKPVVDETKVTNPAGVNQWTPPDPRQDLFWKYYIDPESITFSNATQSALRARFSQEYSLKITSATWFSVYIRRENLLEDAENALKEGVNVDIDVDVMGMFGPIIDPRTKQVMKKKSPELLAQKLNAAKFIASTRGKNKGYSTKVEVEHTIKPTPILGTTDVIIDVEARETK